MLPEYTVVRSKQRRRSIAMTLRADGVLEVRAPKWVSERDVERFILDRIDWVEKQKTRLAKRPTIIEHQYKDGETFYLDGEELTLVTQTGTKKVWVENNCLYVRLRTPTAETIEKAIIQFYKTLALERFQVALADLAADMGETKAMQLLITNAKGRWGSCTDRGRIIRISAKLLMAPPLVQDYVIVHELCHLEHMDHSPRFWAKVGHFCPNFKAHEKALKDNAGIWQF